MSDANKIRNAVIKLGVNKGTKRIYLQGKWLVDAGFEAGLKFKAFFSDGRLSLQLNDDGERKVSGKKEGTVPVIDITGDQLAAAFPKHDSLQVECWHGVIEITPAKSIAKKVARVLTSIAIGLFAGGGLMDVAASQAGFHTAAAVEVNPAFAEVWEANHKGVMYESPIEEVDFHEMAKMIGEPVGLLTAGRPCEPYSNIRRLDRGGQTKRDKSLPPEAHELGHLDFYVLQAVDALNPHTVVIENVPNYLDAGSGYMVQGVLRAMGYTVEARVLNSLDFGELQARKRAVIVATTFDQVRWPDTVTERVTAAKILDQIPDDSLLWFGEEHWAPKHWKKQSAKGNGFAPPAITADSDSIPTLKKRYFAGQGDSFVVAHPNRINTWRWLTLDEGRRLMGVPTSYDLGTTKTIAGEVLGQGVVVGMFRRVIESITRGDDISVATPSIAA